MADDPRAELPVLNTLVDPLPVPVRDQTALQRTMAALTAGSGPLAVDTEH